MELSTFLTSEEKAEQGEELRTLAITHGRTQVTFLDHRMPVIRPTLPYSSAVCGILGNCANTAHMLTNTGIAWVSLQLPRHAH